MEQTGLVAGGGTWSPLLGPVDGACPPVAPGGVAVIEDCPGSAPRPRRGRGRLRGGREAGRFVSLGGCRGGGQLLASTTRGWPVLLTVNTTSKMSRVG